jgi:hypothetical protein
VLKATWFNCCVSFKSWRPVSFLSETIHICTKVGVTAGDCSGSTALITPKAPLYRIYSARRTHTMDSAWGCACWCSEHGAWLAGARADFALEPRPRAEGAAREGPGK